MFRLVLTQSKNLASATGIRLNITRNLICLELPLISGFMYISNNLYEPATNTVFLRDFVEFEKEVIDLLRKYPSTATAIIEILEND